MSFGKGSANSRFPDNAQFYYIDIRSKDLPAPVFRIQQRNEKKEYIIVSSDATRVTGTVVGISNKESKNTKTGATIRSVSLVMEEKTDAKHDVYFVNVPHNYLGWNLLNSLLSLASYDGISVRLYQSKPRPGQDKTFASVSVEQNGEMVYGKFKNEELPEVTKVKVGEDTHSDKSKRQAFFAAEVDKLARVIRNGQPKSTVPATTGAGEGTPDGNADEASDLPF